MKSNLYIALIIKKEDDIATQKFLQSTCSSSQPDPLVKLLPQIFKNSTDEPRKNR
jgi:hypothetical protein